jgi:signal transduction histidine kinase
LDVGEILLADLLSDVEAEVQAGQLKPFAIDYPGLGMEIVRADRDQLFRVFSNLANNAAAAGAASLVVRREVAAGRFRLSIVDNGPGIPEGLHEQLFQPFHVSTPRRMAPVSVWGHRPGYRPGPWRRPESC